MRRLLITTAALLLAVLAATPARAQGATLIVDASNGPGTDFTDLPAAVQSAVPGATIEVRPGQYTGFVTDKGVRIVGQPGVSITRVATGGSGLQRTTFRVEGMPAGQTFSMRDVQVDILGPVPHLVDNGGPVILERIDMRILIIEDCEHVEFHQCNCMTRCSRSELTVKGHDVTGSLLPSVSWGAIVFFDAHCTIEDSRIAGDADTSAITMTNSELRIALRTPGSIVEAGSGSAPGTPAIQGTGTVARDPGVAVTMQGPQEILVELPSLSTAGGGLGQAFATELRGEGQRPFLLLIGSPITKVTLPGVGGGLWLGAPQISAQGVFPSSGTHIHSATIPNQPILLGVPIGQQVVSLDALGGLQLSGASTFAIRP